MHRVLSLSSFQAFRYRGFAALWTGALVSNVGSWMSTVALGVAVTEATGKAAWTGLVMAMTFVPAVFLAPVAGALADRFERRRYLLVLNALQIAVAAALATLAFSGALTVGPMALLAFTTGCANTLASPAFVALISELVPPEALPNAFSLNSAQFNLGRILGPALATLVFALWGAPWAFALNALSFGAVVFALTRLGRAPAPSGAMRPSLWRGIVEGVELARRDAGIRLALGSVLAVAALVAPFIGMIPVYALQTFGGGAETASLFTTAQGMGAVFVALGIGPLVARFGTRNVALTAASLLGPCAVLYWSAPGPAYATAFIALLGGAYLGTLTTFHTVEQLRTPNGLQARVSSLHSMVLGGGYALSLVTAGALADRFGLRQVMIGYALLFVGYVVYLRAFRAGDTLALQRQAAAAPRERPATAPAIPGRAA